MAHFCKLDENNIVEQVVVISNDDIKDENGNEIEEIGIAFCKKIFGDDTNWKQTSYNNNFRVRYAGIGYTYNEEFDAFIPPQPFPSWELIKETVNWQSPLGSPPELTEEQINSGSFYKWDEDLHETDNTQGWILETSV